MSDVIIIVGVATGVVVVAGLALCIFRSSSSSNHQNSIGLPYTNPGPSPTRTPQPNQNQSHGDSYLANQLKKQNNNKGLTNNFFPTCVPYRLDETEILLTRKVSQGTFGDVWLGHYHGQAVAVKRMLDNGDGEAQMFSREIVTMAKLHHPKIVKFIGAIWSTKTDLGAVTEFMESGDVRTLLENRRIDLKWSNQKISIAIDIADALVYLHSSTPKIIHRDLKSRNVLLNSDMVAKLSDFGLSRLRTYEETLTAGVGTVRWTAPEVMLGENYSERADIYSLGVVLSELDTREIPFEEKSSRTGAGGKPDMAIVIKVARGELRPKFSPTCPQVILNIAKACLQFDPALRPSSDAVLKMLHDAKTQLH